jgi:hypothetical protein
MECEEIRRRGIFVADNYHDEKWIDQTVIDLVD